MEDGARSAESVVKGGGKRSAAPLLEAGRHLGKRRRRCALPAQSKTWRPYFALPCSCLLLAAFCLQAVAQSYSVDWHKIAGGGTSTGGVYAVSGTIGQHDASLQPMIGGDYSLTGGFWALISVVQTAGAPALHLRHSGNVITVYWQDTSGWSLVQNGDLTAPIASWPASSGVTTTNGVDYLIVTPPVGNLFFRLSNRAP